MITEIMATDGPNILYKSIKIFFKKNVADDGDFVRNVKTLRFLINP